MFTIRATFNDTLSITASRDAVRDFFLDVANYARLMPGIDGISPRADGVSNWIVAADIPVVGKMKQEFLVRLEEDKHDRIEFGPADAESGNLLRFYAEFSGDDSGPTELQFVQHVEIRRKEAKELHFLAGMAGESIISAEMTKSVSKMIKTFIARAKAELEG